MAAQDDQRHLYTCEVTEHRDRSPSCGHEGPSYCWYATIGCKSAQHMGSRTRRRGCLALLESERLGHSVCVRRPPGSLRFVTDSSSFALLRRCGAKLTSLVTTRCLPRVEAPMLDGMVGQSCDRCLREITDPSSLSSGDGCRCGLRDDGRTDAPPPLREYAARTPACGSSSGEPQLRPEHAASSRASRSAGRDRRDARRRPANPPGRSRSRREERRGFDVVAGGARTVRTPPSAASRRSSSPDHGAARRRGLPRLRLHAARVTARRRGRVRQCREIHASSPLAATYARGVAACRQHANGPSAARSTTLPAIG